MVGGVKAAGQTIKDRWAEAAVRWRL